MVREIEPGELVAIDQHGLRSHRFAPAQPKGCVFEYVYLARPDASSAAASSTRPGSRWAASWPGSTRSTPTSSSGCPSRGVPAAVGYSQEAGIPYGQGFVKNAYVGRTFIQPSQTLRQLGIRLKLNPLEHTIRGKRLVVVDDSIVRGNTQRAHIRMLREAGALEVHVRISSPPVQWPCFYGIDFATRAELIATGLGVEEIRASIGADSLGYISEEGMVAATGSRASACARRASPASTRSSCRPPSCSARTPSSPAGAGARPPIRRSRTCARRTLKACPSACPSAARARCSTPDHATIKEKFLDHELP